MGIFDILGAVGAGIGGAQKGYNQFQQEDRADRQLAQQAALKREEMAQNQSQFDAARMTDLGVLSKFIPGINAEPGTMVDRTNVPSILSSLEKKREFDLAQTGRDELASTLERAGGARPAALTGQLAPGEDPEAEAMIPRTQNVPADPKFSAAAALARRPGTGGMAGVAALMNTLYPESAKMGAPHYETRPDGTYQILPNGQVRKVDVPGKPDVVRGTPHYVDRPDGVYQVLPDGSAVKVPGVPGKPEPLGPTAPHYIEREDGVYQIFPDGRAVKVSGVPGKPVAEKVASPQERQKLADLDTLVESTGALLQNVEKNKDILGGITSNPSAALRRSLGATVYPGAVTPAERQFLADLGTQVAEIRRHLIGAAQTAPELRGLVDSLPEKGEVDLSVIPKLQSLQAQALRARRSLGNILEQSRISVPGAAPQGQGGGGGGDADARARAKYLGR